MSTTTSFIEARLDKARTELADQNLDGMLISDPDNRFYYSGYRAGDHGPTESAGMLLIGPTNQTLLTSPVNKDWAEADAPEFLVAEWSRPFPESIAKEIEKLGWANVGFEPDSLSYAFWSGITDELETAVLSPMGSELDEIRWVKDDLEIAALQCAIDITDEVFAEARSRMRAGQSEAAVARMIEQLFLEHGADGAAFPTIVASGPNAARPHHSPSERLLSDGDVVIVDMGASLNGYCGDVTRTVFVGDVGDKAKRVYDIVVEAQLASLESIRAGVAAKDVDAVARDVFAKHDLEDQFLHSLGHGLGIRVHDGPSVSKTSERALEVGNVLTIEPGLYFAGLFGVRIEDDVVVEHDGYRLLSHASKEMFTISGNGDDFS